MKRYICVIIGIGFAIIYTNCYAIDYVVEFSSSDFTLVSAGEYTNVEHQECNMFGEIGAPQTLVTTLNFIIPVDQTVESIEINEANVDLLSSDLVLFPVQQDEYYYSCCPHWFYCSYA